MRDDLYTPRHIRTMIVSFRNTETALKRYTINYLQIAEDQLPNDIISRHPLYSLRLNNLSTPCTLIRSRRFRPDQMACTPPLAF